MAQQSGAVVKVRRGLRIYCAVLVALTLCACGGTAPTEEPAGNDVPVQEALDPKDTCVTKLLSDLVYAYEGSRTQATETRTLDTGIDGGQGTDAVVLETDTNDDTQATDAGTLDTDVADGTPTAAHTPQVPTVTQDDIAHDLDDIRTLDPDNYEVAQAVVEHWNKVYLDPSYALTIHTGGWFAPELAVAGTGFLERHAFVVLGYALKDGQMTDELKGRCEAAAAAARTYPNALLVCSGGATGTNNPDKHTEAGLMRDYLVDECGIEAWRILADERALDTAQNARNTFAMLRQQDIQTITIVTSSYHQRWGQAVYNAEAAVYARDLGYRVQIVGDYSYDIEPEVEAFRQDARYAALQIAGLLGLPQRAIAQMPQVQATN